MPCASRCRSFEIFNWGPDARASTKAFRAINIREHADRKEMRKFIHDRSRELRASAVMQIILSASVKSR